MKHLVLTLVLAISIPVFSQSGIIGLYVNDNTNEFVYLENDSVWFRINSHSGYNILLFGKGKVEKELDGRLHIMCDKQLMFHTATIDSFPRKDKGISIQGYYRNGVPIPCASCRLTSNGKTHYGMLDMNGIFVLDKKQAKYFCDTETSIELQDIALKAGFHTVLKEGHDYVITSLLPENLVSFPYGGDTLRAQLDFPTPSTLSFSLWDGDYGVFREPSRLSKTKMVFTPSNILFYLTTKEMVCGNRFIEHELTLIPGIYLGENNEDFLILTDDSVCVRLQTSYGITIYTLGLGTYQYADGILRIETNDNLLSTLSTLHVSERNDTCFSFRVVDSDEDPLSFCSIRLSLADDTSTCKNWFTRICSRKNQMKPIEFQTDFDGFIDASKLVPYLDKQVDIYCFTVGAEAKTAIKIKKGFDYVLKNEVPVGFGVCSNGKLELNIHPISEKCIEFVNRIIGYPDLPDHTSLLRYYGTTDFIDGACFRLKNVEIKKSLSKSFQ